MNNQSESIREAISCQEYHRALALWNDYARRLRHAVEAGALGPEQMEEARALYNWSRAVLSGARAHMRTRYRELEVAAAYRHPPVDRAPRPSLFDTHL